MKISILIVLSAFIFGCAPDTNSPQNKYANSEAIVCAKSGLKIRKAANFKSPILSKVPYNAKVKILNRSKNDFKLDGNWGHWVKVKWKNITGWMFDAYLIYGKKYASKRFPKVFERCYKIFYQKDHASPLIYMCAGSYPSLSPNKQFILYTNIDKDNNIYIFGLSNKKIRIIPTAAGRLCTAIWSPDGRHIIADFGTSTYSGASVYNFHGGKPVVSFGYRGTMYWPNPDTIIIQQDFDTKTPRPRDTSGISKVIISKRKVIPIKKPTDTSTVHFLKVINNSIYYVLLKIQNPDNWYLDKAKSTVTYHVIRDGKEYEICEWLFEKLIGER